MAEVKPEHTQQARALLGFIGTKIASDIERVAQALADLEARVSEAAYLDGIRYAAGFVREHATTLTDFAGKRAVELAALVLLQRSREGAPQAGEAPATNDVTSGLPPFGVDPEDSARLLELRQAIDDHLPWPSEEEKERGDYVVAVKYAAERLDALEHDFARVVYLGNNIAPLSTEERSELNGLLAKAYEALKRRRKAGKGGTDG